MLGLSEGKVESLLERANARLSVAGVPEDASLSHPLFELKIQFEAIWPTVHGKDKAAQTLLLVSLAANRPDNQFWTPNELQILREFLEERLICAEWLEWAVSCENLAIVLYARDYITARQFGPVEVRPFQLSVAHVWGVLNTLDEHPPNNMAKTLDAIDSLHKAKLFLEMMTPFQLALYRSDLEECNSALNLVDYELQMLVSHVQEETAAPVSDAEMAVAMQHEEDARAIAAIPDVKSSSEPHRSDCNCRRCIPPFNPWSSPRTEFYVRRAPDHPLDCGCTYCIPHRMLPETWTPDYASPSCACYICYRDDTVHPSTYVRVVMNRMRIWGCPAHFSVTTVSDIIHDLNLGTSAKIWAERQRVWDAHLRREGVDMHGALFNAACAVCLTCPGSSEGGVAFQLWLSRMLNEYPEELGQSAAMLVCLLFASATTRQQVEAIDVTPLSLQKFATLFRKSWLSMQST